MDDNVITAVLRREEFCHSQLERKLNFNMEYKVKSSETQKPLASIENVDSRGKSMKRGSALLLPTVPTGQSSWISVLHLVQSSYSHPALGFIK